MSRASCSLNIPVCSNKVKLVGTYRSGWFCVNSLKVWYSIGMTKLQTIVAEIKALPVDEQREVISQFEYLTAAVQDEYIFTDEEWAEIDDMLKNDTGSFTVEEVFDTLREKYAPGTTAK